MLPVYSRPKDDTDDDKNQYESDEDQFQESIVNNVDGRHKIDVFQPESHDIYGCIGELDIEYDYKKTHKCRLNATGTGTVIFVKESNKHRGTGIILTCAHNVRTTVTHCTKNTCNTYRITKTRGQRTRCLVCKQRNGATQKQVIIKATKITFRDRSIEYGNNYGKTLANYNCTEIYVPNKKYMKFPKPKDGFDWAFLAISDIGGVYKNRLDHISIDLVNGNKLMSDDIKKRTYAIFGYPQDKDHKMVGMKSDSTNQFEIIQNFSTKQYYLHQIGIDTKQGQSGALVWYVNEGEKTIKICAIHSGGSQGTKSDPQPYNIATLINEEIIVKYNNIKNGKTMGDSIKVLIDRTGVNDVDIKIDSVNNKEYKENDIFSVQLKESNEYFVIDRQFEFDQSAETYNINGLQDDTMYILRVKPGVNDDNKNDNDWWNNAVIAAFKTEKIHAELLANSEMKFKDRTHFLNDLITVIFDTESAQLWQHHDKKSTKNTKVYYIYNNSENKNKKKKKKEKLENICKYNVPIAKAVTIIKNPIKSLMQLYDYFVENEYVNATFFGWEQKPQLKKQFNRLERILQGQYAPNAQIVNVVASKRDYLVYETMAILDNSTNKMMPLNEYVKHNNQLYSVDDKSFQRPLDFKLVYMVRSLNKNDHKEFYREPKAKYERGTIYRAGFCVEQITNTSLGVTTVMELCIGGNDVIKSYSNYKIQAASVARKVGENVRKYFQEW